jgi:hypothetical protein
MKAVGYKGMASGAKQRKGKSEEREVRERK